MADPVPDLEDKDAADASKAGRAVLLGRVAGTSLALFIALVGTWIGVPSMFALAPVSFVLLLSIFTWFADGRPDLRHIVHVLMAGGIGGAALLAATTALYTGPHVVPTMSVAIGLVAFAAIGGAQQGYFR
jgi:hypothetical protein